VPSLLLYSRSVKLSRTVAALPSAENASRDNTAVHKKACRWIPANGADCRWLAGIEFVTDSVNFTRLINALILL
jgi:hypothetical protein